MQWSPAPKSKARPRWAFRIRHWHIWAGVLSSIPAFVILFTGLVLLMRRQLPAMHPPTFVGERPGISLTLAEVVEHIRPLGKVRSVADVSKAEAHPGKGIWKLRTRDSWEVQVDAHTGAVLNSQPRTTGWWIGLHEGSLFSLWVTYLIFLPSTLAMLWLWGSGLYLFFRFRR